MTHTMLNSFVLPKYLWAEAVNIACYILNRIIIRPIFKRLFMNFSLDKSQIYHISKFLDVSALSLIPKIIWANLIQNRMKAYFLVIPLLVKLIECLINTH